MFTERFFHLNLLFAETTSRILEIPLPQALLDYTHLYLSFGLGRDFDPDHPTWQAYLSGLERQLDLVKYTYCIYRQCQEVLPPKVASPSFGCFSYALWPGDRVRIHFHNIEPGDISPLGLGRFQLRREELRTMFDHLRNIVPETATVIGGSWLYNLEAYRRLFPPEFLETAQEGQDEYRYIALWGQFLDRRGELRVEPARIFQERLATLRFPDDLPYCFPMQLLRLECPISVFWATRI